MTFLTKKKPPPKKALAPVAPHITDETATNIRAMAKILFVTSIGHMELGLMHAQEPFSKVTFDQLRYWKKVDQWEVLRTAFQKEVNLDILKTKRKELVEVLQGINSRIDPIIDRAEKALKEMNFSGEEPSKLIGALVKLYEIRTKFSGDVANLLREEPPPPAPGQPDPTGAVVKLEANLTNEELKEAAEAILRSRMAKSNANVIDVSPEKKG